jgi:hypothetical protein
MMEVASRLGGIEATQKGQTETIKQLSSDMAEIKETHAGCRARTEGDRESTKKIKLELDGMKNKVSDHGKDLIAIKATTTKFSISNLHTWAKIIPYIIMGLTALGALVKSGIIGW